MAREPTFLIPFTGPEAVLTIPRRSHPVTALYENSLAKPQAVMAMRHTTRLVVAPLTDVPR